MSRGSQQSMQRIATIISGLLKGITFYPASHPSLLRPMEELNLLLGELFREETELTLGVTDGTLYVGEQLFVRPTPPVAELASGLSARGIDAVTLIQGVTLEQLGRFFTLAGDRKSEAELIAAGLLDEGIESIRINGITRRQQEEVLQPSDGGPYDSRVAYDQALTAVKGIWKEIQQGRIPNSAEVVAVVDTMVEMAIQDPSTLLCLSMIKEYDNYTFTHCVNVGVLSLALAAALGTPREALRDTGVAGMLHDIGKIRIDKQILNKPGKLAAAEFEQVKKHSEFGAKIVEKMEGLSDDIVQAVLGHHIHFNRNGYPEWARELPFSEMTDIIAVSDTYDAVTTLRPYMRPQSPKAAVDIMRRLSGTKLNGALVEKFVTMMGEYPVGSLVRLDNNELAVVFRSNPEERTRPTVKVIIDCDGNLLAQPRTEPLVRDGLPSYAAIVAVADPLTRNIDPACYLT